MKYVSLTLPTLSLVSCICNSGRNCNSCTEYPGLQKCSATPDGSECLFIMSRQCSLSLSQVIWLKWIHTFLIFQLLLFKAILIERNIDVNCGHVSYKQANLFGKCWHGFILYLPFSSSELCGCALRIFGSPWVAHLVCAIPKWVSNSFSFFRFDSSEMAFQHRVSNKKLPGFKLK